MFETTKTIFWENSPFPGNQSDFHLTNTGLPVIEVGSLYEIGLPNQLPLLGMTDSGEYISVFRLQAFESDIRCYSHTWNRSDAASSTDNERFSCFRSSFLLVDYILGDSRIEHSNPPVSLISISSRDLQALAVHSGITSIPDKPFRSQLFCNSTVTISLEEKAAEVRHPMSTEKTLVISLIFEFSNEVGYDYAVDKWVIPLVQLMGILCGGIVSIDGHSVLSKAVDARFTGSKIVNIGGGGSSPNGFVTALLPFGAERINYQQLISEWMERPNTLRGIGAELLATRYGDIHSHSKAIASMRGIEAMFADRTIQNMRNEQDVPISQSGIFDMTSQTYGPVRKALKELENKPGFAVKLRSCVERFRQQFECNKGNAINWDMFVAEAKDLRNGAAHGTVVGGYTGRNEERTDLIVHTCFTLYSLAVLSLAYEHDEDLPLLISTHGPVTLGRGLAGTWPLGRDVS